MSEEQLQANHSILAKHFPNLYQSIQQKQSTPSAMEPAVQPCKQHGYTVQVNSQTGKRFLHNQYDSIKEAQRWVNENIPTKGAVAIIMGWGLGYFALEWIKQHGTQCNAIIVWEPEPQFFIDSLPYIDLSPLNKNKNIQIILGCQKGLLYQNLHQCLSHLLSNELKIVACPFVDVYGKEPVQLLKQEVSQIVATKNNALKFMTTMGERCQTHLIQNLKYLPNCWMPHDLAGIAHKQPGIIIAAGPSLDKNIDQINDLTDKAWLFAVDTSLPILVNKGIQPDFVVSKDPTELNTKHFKKLSNTQSFPTLAFDPIIPPETSNLFSGNKVWLPGRNKQIYNFLDQFHLQPIDNLPFSTNVSIAAFNLAKVMGCDPIIFVGLDLCFAESTGKSHAEETALCSSTVFNQENNQLTYTRGDSQDTVQGLMVEGIDGKLYPTIENFYEALGLLEQLIHQSQAQCIDASEGGAKIAGTDIMTLNDVKMNYCQKSINKNMPETVKYDPNAFRENLYSLIKYIEECQTIAQEALNQLKDTDCYDCINLAAFDIKRGWLEEKNKLYSLLEPALERLMVEIDRPGFFDTPQSDDDQLEHELIRRYAAYFFEIEKACHTYIPIFKKTADSI